MSKKITLITAFFPLSRESWNDFERSNDKYFNYFEFWARIQNDLIVYTTSEFKERVLEIRKKFGRNNTIVITMDNFLDADKELYNSIKNVNNYELSRDFRLKPNNPECWNAEYNYVMLLKEWCINDAISKNLVSGMIAWIDFGFNHCSDYYLKAEEFDFLWEYDFTNKIHVFAVNDDDNLPIFEIVRRMNVYIQGCLIVAPADLWVKLWNMVRENMIALNKVGLMDDDQTILTMSYRENSDIFELHNGPWFSQFSLCSNQSFTIKNEVNNSNVFKRFKSKIGHCLFIRNYSQKWKKILNKNRIKG